MRVVVVMALIVLFAGCGASTTPTRPRVGAVAGLVRDRDSGELIAKARIELRSDGANSKLHTTTTNQRGLYDFDHLSPGRYHLRAEYAGQPVEIVNIVVAPGEASLVDVMFTLGRPDPLHTDFGDPRAGSITTYHRKNRGASVTAIEGTVTDLASRAGVAGAIVTVEGHEILQTATDEQGRYRFDAVAPGTYAVSTYYSIGGRGQIEVRRSDIVVRETETVVVPLSIELTR
ncbi:MAG: carboxypeptidase regulatory-like domain-containing protein [Kofleriaceae bacterium]